MHKSSSRRNNRSEKTGKGEMEKCSLTDDYSDAPSGVFPSEDSESSHSTSTYRSTTKKTVVKETFVDNSDYDSMEEYQVTFPTVELKLPRHRRRHHQKPSGPTEYVTVTRNVDRRQVYGESNCNDSVTEYSTYTYSTHPDRSILQSPDIRTDRTGASNASASGSTATDRTLNSQHRLQSIGNMFTSIVDFFRNNPKLTKFVFGIILCYVAVCNLEVLIPRVIAIVVRLCYPWARYFAVVTESFFTTIANTFTRMDAVIYASYCEFAAKYCRSRRLMCDVTCSFVDHVLSQARPTLAPIPQH